MSSGLVKVGSRGMKTPSFEGHAAGSSPPYLLHHHTLSLSFSHYVLPPRPPCKNQLTSPSSSFLASPSSSTSSTRPSYDSAITVDRVVGVDVVEKYSLTDTKT